MDHLGKRGWIETAFLCGAALLIFHTMGVLMFLFLVPLHIAAARNGYESFLVSAAGFLAVTGLIGLLQTGGIEPAQGIQGLRTLLIVIEIAFPGLLLIGYGVTIYPGDIYRKDGYNRGLYKYLTGVAVLGLLSIPLLIWFSNSEAFAAFAQSQLEVTISILREMFSAGEDFESTVMQDFLRMEVMLPLIRETLLNNYLFSSAVLLAVSWRVAKLFTRVSGGDTFLLRRFSMPDAGIWPLLFSGALILISYFINLGVFRHAAWNIGLLTAFLYAVQGAAIISHWLTKREMSKKQQRWVWILVFVLLFWPGLNLIVIIGLPGLGISELWIKYRLTERSGGHESHTE